jgi:hypothetical protein
MEYERPAKNVVCAIIPLGHPYIEVGEYKYGLSHYDLDVEIASDDAYFREGDKNNPPIVDYCSKMSVGWTSNPKSPTKPRFKKALGKRCILLRTLELYPVIRVYHRKKNSFTDYQIVHNRLLLRILEEHASIYENGWRFTHPLFDGFIDYDLKTLQGDGAEVIKCGKQSS